MKIKQFEYEPLAHFSYAIVSNGEMMVVDPERNPMKYYAFAKANNAKIVAVFETHPHADFVSSHLQMHKETGAIIYVSNKVGADYPHHPFDEGDTLQIGGIVITAINTPGHSPDSIAIVAKDGKKVALFTGDTLFIGDVGRPDLREKAGNMKAKRQELAEMMFQTIQHKFTGLPDNALVYPAHGAGTLCGKNISSDKSSTLGNERMGNWAFKEQTKEKFIDALLDGQPFIPSYFGYNVDTNKTGAPILRNALAKIPFKLNGAIDNGALVIDVRDEATFKRGHIKGSLNIQATSKSAKFETWLGAIVEPDEKFNLVIEHPKDLEDILERVAVIGYEVNLLSVATSDTMNLETMESLDLNDFKKHPDNYTIVDIRNTSEVEEEKFFESAISHPLNELRETANDIPTDKPIVVHCAGGYRSAAGSSIIKNKISGTKVYDLSDDIEKFK